MEGRRFPSLCRRSACVSLVLSSDCFTWMLLLSAWLIHSSSVQVFGTAVSCIATGAPWAKAPPRASHTNNIQNPAFFIESCKFKERNGNRKIKIHYLRLQITDLYRFTDY